MCLLSISQKMDIERFNQQNKKLFPDQGAGVGVGDTSQVFKSVKGSDDQGLSELLSLYTQMRPEHLLASDR